MSTLNSIFGFNEVFLLTVIILVNIIILNNRVIIASKLRINDYPNNRKIHSKPTPMMGGVCMFVSLMSISIYNYFYNEYRFNTD